VLGAKLAPPPIKAIGLIIDTSSKSRAARVFFETLGARSAIAVKRMARRLYVRYRTYLLALGHPCGLRGSQNGSWDLV